MGGPTTPREVLDAIGIQPISVRRATSVHTNDFWRVRTTDGLLFLRRSIATRSINAVEHELAILERLAGREWPVPTAVHRPLVADSRVWTAFDALPGRIRRAASAVGERREQAERGRLLGRLHFDMAAMDDLGQKPGLGRAEVSFARLEGQLAGLARSRPNEARRLAQHLDRTQLDLQELRADQQPVQMIHGDFSTWNLLFTGGALTGLLDFDLCHVNHRVADFAISWRGVYDDVVVGYTETNLLTPTDWALLVPVFRAWYLWQASEKFVGSTIPDPQLGFLLSNLDKTPTLGA